MYHLRTNNKPTGGRSSETSSHPIDINNRTYRLLKNPHSDLKMETVYLSETLVSAFKSTRCSTQKANTDTIGMRT
jgi:hypothetical protein